MDCKTFRQAIITVSKHFASQLSLLLESRALEIEHSLVVVSTNVQSTVCLRAARCGAERHEANLVRFSVQVLYGLRVGDSLVFGRMPNGELVACGRLRQGPPPPTRSPAPESPFVPLDRSKRRRKAPQKLYNPADFSEQKEYTWNPQVRSNILDLWSQAQRRCLLVAFLSFGSRQVGALQRTGGFSLVL